MFRRLALLGAALSTVVALAPVAGPSTAASRTSPPGNLTRVEIGDRDGHGEWGGRAGTVTLTGSEGALTMSGSEFSQRLSLASPWLTLRGPLNYRSVVHRSPLRG